ncbi:MAG: GNVR domain-containing protein [Fidelibacterota bacterium]
MKERTRYPILTYIILHWKLNFTVVMLAWIGIILYVFLVAEKKYTADISIIPSAASFSSRLAGGNLSSLAGLTGLDLSTSSGQSQEMYEGILNSRQLLRRILYDTYDVIDGAGHKIKKNLIDYLEIKSEDDLEKFGKALKYFKEEVIYIGIDPESNILSLAVTLPDPYLAAEVANRMVTVLDDIVRNQVQKEYHEQYEYLTSRITQTQDSILAAEKDLEKFLEKMSAIMEPSTQIKEIRYRRNLEIHTAIYTELAKQKEMFVLQNMVNLNPVKVLDQAIPPYKKSRPKRILLTISLGFLWLCAQVGINASIVYSKKIKSDLTSNISSL